MKRLPTIILLLLLTGLVPVGAARFATKRLESIAQCLHLPMIDTLQAGNATTAYRLNGRHALMVRANRYGEISHIGLHLFPREMRDAAPSPIYDFLERNLLERNLPNLNGQLKHQQKSEHVYFGIGSARTPLSFNGTEEFSEERVDLKRYRATWQRNGREVLKISFDMDYELLSGCNSIELEQLFLRRLKHFKPGKGAVSALQHRDFPATATQHVAKGDSFLIAEMRNDLYFERTDSGWQLANHAENTSKTLANMMLSPEFSGHPALQLLVDQYGYASDTVAVAYQDLLQMCMEDGCTPYFGIKERKEDGAYTGTVLLVNRRGGYVHMLSAAVPAETLASGGNGTMRGRLYVFIPMHNVSDRYFQQTKKK